MELKSVRRVIVGHDQQGKAVALFDGPATPKARSPGGNAVLNLWVTSEFPVDMNSGRLGPPTGGRNQGRRSATGSWHHFPNCRFSSYVNRSPLQCRTRTTKKR